MTDKTTGTPEAIIPGDQAQGLLELLSTWGPLTTIVFSGGCVFEFKGEFPKGTSGEGFYNFGHVGQGGRGSEGFQGHLNLKNVKSISFQDKLHRGRQSYAFVFRDKNNDCIFKVFLGRDESGELIQSQVDGFKEMQAQAKQLKVNEQQG